MSETPEQVQDTETTEDFDQFWEQVDRKGKTIKVMGERIELPPALPLQFELEARRLQRSKSDKDIRKLLTILGFPEDAQERWAKAGMDLEQFQVLLAWAPAVIAGRNMTLAEVREHVREQAAKQAARAEGNGKG